MSWRWAAAAFLAMSCLPGLALASGGAHGFSLKEHGYYVIDFVVFVALMVWLVRRPLSAAVEARSERIARRLKEAGARFADAEARLAESRARLADVEREKGEMLARLTEEGKRLRARIEEETAAEQEKIRRGVLSAVEAEKSRLERKLRTEVALASVDLAEQRLKAEWPRLPHDQYARAFTEALSARPGAGEAGR